NDFGESVLKFDPTLHLLGHFLTFPGDDRDLASLTPAVLPNNLLFQTGKQQTGYLVDRTTMTALQQFQVCHGVADSATAFDGSPIFIPCQEHIKEVNVNTAARTMSLGWAGPGTGDAGPPILSGGIMWSVDFARGVMYGLNPANGAVLQTIGTG